MGYRIKRQIEQPLDKPFRLIPLTRGMVTLVDAGDYEYLSRFNWSALWLASIQKFYAVRKEGCKYIYMHRELLGSNPKELADHRDGNSLNNQRCNLRKCNSAQNNRNRKAKFPNRKGVTKTPAGNWAARIHVNNRPIYLGTFNSGVDAARAYNVAAVQHFGEFARLNEVADGD